MAVPHVVIVGGGFAGLYCAKRLRKAPVRLTVVDRRNHHLFQPLLYQVATSMLSPADIASPIRHILSRQRNAEVVLAEARGVDLEGRRLLLDDGELAYDVLVIATGATYSYFGKDEWSRWAPGLKTVEDALEIRERFLLAFEFAERETDPELRRAALTFVVVGGGSTGVELAGAMAEIARRAIHRDFRNIDTSSARVILIEGNDRVLPSYPEELSRRARDDLERLGVDVWLQTRVTDVDEGGVRIGGERIQARNVFWAAGVRGSSLAGSLGVALDGLGRVPVRPDLTLDGRPEVFVVGDLARVVDPQSQKEVPGIAPAAIQMGSYVAGVLARESRAGGSPGKRAPFVYRDKGMLSTIGRAKAVGVVGPLRLRGYVAWWAWLLIHIAYLIGFRNRLTVLLQWAWAYWTFDRGARLITRERGRGTGA